MERRKSEEMEIDCVMCQAVKVLNAAGLSPADGPLVYMAPWISDIEERINTVCLNILAGQPD